MADRITFEKDYQNKIFIIKINDPTKLNSVYFEDFLKIASLLNSINDDPGLIITMIQSSGKVFSTGGKYESVKRLKGNMETENPVIEPEYTKLNHFVGNISSLNVYISSCFIRHKNPVVCCLNGPAIGLSASLVLLCDMIYSKNLDDIYLLFPFSSLGFVAEVGSSVTLYNKLGVNMTNEHLLFSKPISGQAMMQNGLINKDYDIYDGKGQDKTELFNQRVRLEIGKKLAGLHDQSITSMKSLLAKNLSGKLTTAQSVEVNGTLPLWLSGEPHRRFEQLSSKRRRHKL